MINSRATSRLQPASAFHFLLITLSFFVFLVSAFLFHDEAFCAQATLAWDPETVSGLAGYRVHYGTVSENYSFVVDAGNQTTATITGLTTGATYYFAATAYNTAGAESTYSNEVSYTVPSSCNCAISPGSATFTAAGGTGSVTVTTSSTCSWTAANPGSWINITSGTSGTGNGTVGYSVSANTSGSRTAAMTIAGAVFSITQAGVSTNTITASAGTGGSISPSGSASVTAGASQSFTITPASGYQVAAVTVDGASVGALTSYTFTNVTANHTIAASFTARTPSSYTLTVSTAGTGTGTVTNSPSGTSFSAGTSVTLTATPGRSSVFSGWSGACSGTSRTCTITMNSNASVTATFSSRRRH